MSGTKVSNVIGRLLKESNSYLIINQTENTVKVGPYLITQDGDIFVLTCDEVTIDEFNDKKAAVAYAITLYNKQKSKSRAIKEYDVKIGKYRSDIIFYRRSIMIAQKKNDNIRRDIVENRLEVAFHELSQTKKSLLREIKNIQIA